VRSLAYDTVEGALRSGEEADGSLEAQIPMWYGRPHEEERRSRFMLFHSFFWPRPVASKSPTAPRVSDGSESQSPTLVRTRTKFGEAASRRSAAG
jgi:hypothetical protein